MAQACRNLERLRFRYADSKSKSTERHVEPFQLVHTARVWYLVAMDRNREASRTFRVDRMAEPVRTEMRFTHVDPPDAAALVSEGLAVQVYTHQARILLDVPYDLAIERISPSTGVLEKRRNGTLLRIGADDLEWLAGFLAGLDCKFQILEPEGLKAAVAALGRRLIENAS